MRPFPLPDSGRWRLLAAVLAGGFAWLLAGTTSAQNVTPTAGVTSPVQPATGPGAERFEQGRVLFDQGRYAAAAARFEEATAAQPQRSLYAQWLGRALGLAARDASLLARPGLAGRSRAALERAVALDPDNVGARSDLAAYYAAAPGFLGGGMDKARAQVAEIARRDPYLGEVRGGDLLLDTNRFDEAERRYAAAVRLDPRRTDARRRLGFLHARRGRFAEAFAEWDAVLAADPNQPQALFGLGRTADLSGERLAAGEAALQRFLGLTGRAAASGDGPSPARAHFVLGNLARRRGDVATARSRYETALRLDPRNNDARQALAGLGR